MSWQLTQVDEYYVHLVTSINNADTLVTLIVPSVLIIFSNVRISVALSQFRRNGDLMLCNGDLMPPQFRCNGDLMLCNEDLMPQVHRNGDLML